MKILMYLVKKSYTWDDDEIDYKLQKYPSEYGTSIPVAIEVLQDNADLKDLFS